MHTSNYFERTTLEEITAKYKAMLSYNIDCKAKELYFYFGKTPSLIRHSMEHNKQILRNEKR